MKTIKMKQLNEKDEEIADALISLGMSRNIAMTLTYMQNTNSAIHKHVNCSVDFLSYYNHFSSARTTDALILISGDDQYFLCN